MLTQTLQGALQAEIRAATGKTNQDFNGDLHDLCTIYGVPMAPISGRIIPVAQIFDSSINSSSAALNYLLKNATTVVGPRGLFASGEQGAWYDPSDLTTLFQDSAGTTPVTAVEQPVGLVLDKSKGLVLGSELAPSPTPDGAGWSSQGTISVSGNQITFGSQFANRRFNITSVEGIWYRLTFKARRISGNTTLWFLHENSASGDTTQFTITDSIQTYTVYFRGRTGGGLINVGIQDRNAAGWGTIEAYDFSTRVVSGNHAYQTTSTSRPTLRARYNLLTYSEQFDNSIWNTVAINAFGSGSVVNTTATFDPLGGNTAEFIQENTTASTTHGLNTSVTLIANTTYTITCYFKAATRTLAIIGIDSAGGNGARAFFNLSTGAVGASSALGTGTLVSAPSPVNVGNGWYRCQLTAKVDPAATSAILRLSMAETDGVQTYTGNGTSGIYIWGAQLTQTAVFPSNTYQRIAAATDYATGAAFPPYLFFDGVDDSLLTNSVDFSATDKMTVWAGVTKSSDAAAAILAELSATAFTNNGAFAMSAPGAALNSFFFRSRGTAVSDTEATFAAPTTKVVTGIADIGADTNVLRVNGTQAATSATDQGTGNFGNYPLYIGRRNNATLPLNGNIYSLIIRGAQSTAAQISSTESWVAAKTPLGSL